MPSITRHPWIINRQWQYRKVSQFRVLEVVCLIPFHTLCVHYALKMQEFVCFIFNFDLRAVKNKLRGKFKKIVRFMAFSP